MPVNRYKHHDGIVSALTGPPIRNDQAVISAAFVMMVVAIDIFCFEPDVTNTSFLNGSRNKKSVKRRFIVFAP